MIKSVLITGANAGLGKEAAKQFSMRAEVEKIILACRSFEKAEKARIELTEYCERDIFEILILDISNIKSIKNAVTELNQGIDVLLMNAGGTGGSNFSNINELGVTEIFSVNLLGHALLFEELIAAGKIKQHVLYAGSEAARGVPEMGMKQPSFKTSSIDEFIALADGSLYKDSKDPTDSYGSIKYIAALWMSALSRHHPDIKFLTVSPGATVGTEGFNSLPLLKRLFMKSMMQAMLLIGKVHRVEKGASRYLECLYDEGTESGAFYASQKGLTGPLSMQQQYFPDLIDTRVQDNAYQAIQSLINRV